MRATMSRVSRKKIWEFCNWPRGAGVYPEIHCQESITPLLCSLTVGHENILGIEVAPLLFPVSRW